MTVYSFYIFDRHTECIYSKHWLPAAAPAPPSADNAQGTQQTPLRRPAPPTADDAKLIFGAVFSLRNMARKVGGPEDTFISYSTGQYKLHFFETASNLRFVLLTDPNTQNMRPVLHQIYVNLWVEHVVKNPLAPVEHKGGVGVRSELFEQVLDRFLGTLGYA